MGWLAPILGLATIADLTLPGSHDTFTDDISSRFATNGLHDAMKFVPVGSIRETLQKIDGLGDVIAPLGQAQGIDVVAQLNGGIRFLDVRVSYEYGKGDDSSKHWYAIHGAQTNHQLQYFFDKVKTWLVDHPTEVLVIWMTRHGNCDKTVEEQFPGTSPKILKAFWQSIEQTFTNKNKSMLFNFNGDHQSVFGTPLKQMVQAGQQIVFMTASWEEFTGSSPLAAPCNTKTVIGNADESTVTGKRWRQPPITRKKGILDNSLSVGHAGRAILDRWNTQNLVFSDPQDLLKNKFRLFAMSWYALNDVNQQQMFSQMGRVSANHPYLLSFYKTVKGLVNPRKCTQAFGIPGFLVSDWCPMKAGTLLDVAHLVK
jgi:hypothetical protein